MPTNIRLDSAAVRVLAHPLRSRLLSALRLYGPATATELADRLAAPTPAPPATTSASSSPWAWSRTPTRARASAGSGGRPASPTPGQPSDFEGDDDAKTSLGWLTRDYVRTAAEQMQRWMDIEQSWPVEWRDALGIGDDVVEVTAAQAKAMQEELIAVVARYRTCRAGRPRRASGCRSGT